MKKIFILIIIMILSISTLFITSNVNAYENNLEKSFQLSDLDNTNKIYSYFFNVNSLDINDSSNNGLVIVSFNLQGNYLITISFFNNTYNSFGLFVYCQDLNGNVIYGNLSTFDYSSHYDDIFALSINNTKVYLSRYNSNELSSSFISVDSFTLPSLIYGYFSNNNFVPYNIIISGYSSYWLTDRYTTNYNSSLINYNEALYLMLSSYDSPNIDPLEYHNEYLFGDLISSFLNIKLGEYNIGGVTLDLTLGSLLLFILGIGALFIIVKIFLGG